MTTARRKFVRSVPLLAVGTSGCFQPIGGEPDAGKVHCGDQTIDPAKEGTLPSTTHEWPTAHHDQRRSARSQATDVPTQCAQLQWSFEAPGGPVRPDEDESRTEPTDGPQNGGITVVNGTAFFPTLGVLYALDLQSGTVQWDQPIDKDGIDASSPVVSDQRIYLSTAHDVYALEVTSGNETWKEPLDRYQSDTRSFIFTAPTIGNSKVFVGNATGTLYALNKENGETEWEFDAKLRNPEEPRSPQESNLNSFRGTFALGDGIVYTGNLNGRVYAFNEESGEKKWAYNEDSVPGPGAGVESAPTLTKDRLFITTETEVRAHDRQSGEVTWTYSGDPGAALGSPVVTEDTVYAATGDFYESISITAIDRESRTVNWEYPGRPIGDMTLAEETLFVGLDNQLVAIDATTGDRNWAMDLDGGGVVSRDPPAVIDGGVLVMDVRGVLFALGHRSSSS